MNDEQTERALYLLDFPRKINVSLRRRVQASVAAALLLSGLLGLLSRRSAHQGCYRCRLG